MKIGAMNHSEQALRALADLIISYSNRTDIPQADREGHLRCAEMLRRAQDGEMTYLEAADAMEASAVVNGAL